MVKSGVIVYSYGKGRRLLEKGDMIIFQPEETHESETFEDTWIVSIKTPITG
jgi:hypothetical protein